MIRAYLIDPFKLEVTEVEHDPANYRQISELIEAKHFTAPWFNNHGDAVYVDHEGLKPEQRFFGIHGHPTPLPGKGLVLGVDKMGETIEASVSLEWVKRNVIFPQLDALTIVAIKSGYFEEMMMSADTENMLGNL